MKVLFTICGRAGSKGFRNKNLKEMNGIPLVCYTLAAIKGYRKKHPEDEIITALNTDSPELQSLVSSQSVLPDVCFVERKPELAGDTIAKVDVIKDTYLSLRNKADFDVVVDLDITSPLRTVHDLEEILRIYQDKRHYELVYSVVPSRRSPYFNMVETKPDGFFRKVCQSNFTARQQAPVCYELNASIYAYRPSFLESEIKKTILDYNCGISVMKDYLVLDIDSEEDFRMMSFLHNYFCENDSGIREIYELAKK